MSDLIGIRDACAILKLRGANVTPQLLNHYCTTGRAPAGTIKIGRCWMFSKRGVEIWQPVIKKAGRPRKKTT